MTPVVPQRSTAQIEQVDRAVGAFLSEAAIPDDLALAGIDIQDRDGTPTTRAVPAAAGVDHAAVDEALECAQADVAAGRIEQVICGSTHEFSANAVRYPSSVAYRTQCGIWKASGASICGGCVGAVVGATWVRRSRSSPAWNWLNSADHSSFRTPGIGHPQVGEIVGPLVLPGHLVKQARRGVV